MILRSLLAGLGLLAVYFLVAANSGQISTQGANEGREVAIFAGGCFWCVESDFDKVPGVLETISGYTGGTLNDPTYKQVSAGGTGHFEAVKIVFDARKVTYEKLLYHFWRSVDPTDGGGQFCDRGQSYKTAIFATTDQQKQLAEKSKKMLQDTEALKAPIVTPVLAAGRFYPAEDYHQDYYKKNPVRYKIYRYSCGRDARVRSLWGKEAHGGRPQN